MFIHAAFRIPALEIPFGTEPANVTEERAVHPLKALFPTPLIFSEKMAVDNFVHPLNILVVNNVKVILSATTFVNSVHP